VQLLKWLGPKQSEISIDLDALRKHHADERLAVVEWIVVEPVAEHD
jgi:hypothetical protein